MCIRSVCWCVCVCVFVCRQKSVVAHLVVFRPGLWRQTAGDEEESSALQFRTLPTEHNTSREAVCVCSSVCVQCC